MAVPVVAAVAINRTGVGAAGVGHAAARLHIHLPRLRQTESPTHTQTLQANKCVRIVRALNSFSDSADGFAVSTRLSGKV